MLENKSNSRNYGIDLLRILAMLMIIIHHILGHGGIIENSCLLSNKYEMVNWIEIMVYCAVNCYAMISGYVGVDKKTKYSNIIYLWLQVVVCTLFFTVCSCVVNQKNITIEQLKDICMPVTRMKYWYFTAYFATFLFMPFYNKLLNTLNNKELKNLALIMFAILSVWNTYARKDIFHLEVGYSFVWISALYIFGGIIKKTEMLKYFKNRYFCILFLFLSIISLLAKYYFEYNKITSTDSNVLIQYTSPTIFIMALSLFMILKNFEIKNKIWIHIIEFISPLTFGTYLIQENDFVRETFIEKRFVNCVSFPIGKLIIFVIISAILIFGLCILLDYVRLYIFNLFRIKESLKRLEDKVRNSRKNKIELLNS